MLRIVSIIAGCVIVSMSGVFSPARAQTAVADTTVAPVVGDSARVALPDTLQSITVHDSLGIPGTLRGETMSPDETKAVLERMGSSEVTGKTQWERKKNPKVAMLCSALLPGLGQVYNGRRLKVGLMVGFASYYYGNTILNYKRWKAAEARRDLYEPGSNEFEFQNQLAGFYQEEARTYLWWSGAVWLIGLIDSWIDAHLYDVRNYTPPAPPETVTPRGANDQINYLTIGFDLDR